VLYCTVLDWTVRYNAILNYLNEEQHFVTLLSLRPLPLFLFLFFQGQAVYAAEADRLRALAEGRQQQSPLAAVLEALPSTAWVSLFTSSAIGVYLVVTSFTQSGVNPG